MAGEIGGACFLVQAEQLRAFRPSFELGCCPALGLTKLVSLAHIEFFS
jgi:hypothetical protein